MTVLSIAHRLTTLKNSDQVLVMDQGLSYRRETTGSFWRRRDFPGYVLWKIKIA